MNIVRITVYPIIVEVCFVAISLGPIGTISRIMLVLALALIVLGTVRVLWERQSDDNTAQYRSERFIALMSIVLLAAIIVSVNAEGILSPPSDAVDKTLPSPKNQLQSHDAASSVNETLKAIAPKVNEPRQSANRLSNRGRTKIGNAAEALEKFDNTLKSADRLLKDGNQQQAERLLIDAIEWLDKQTPGALSRRSRAVRMLVDLRFSVGRFDEGLDAVDQHIEILEKGESVEPKVVASFHELAGTLLGNNNAFGESILRFEELLAYQRRAKVGPVAIASTHAKLAISHAELNEKGTAKKELEEARRVLDSADVRDIDIYRRLDQIAKEYGLDL